jgi:hypothetical protein
VVTVEDAAYYFSHSLANCTKMSEYFNLLCEDMADDPEIIPIPEIKPMVSSYQLPGLPKKAFAVRSGDETGLERLLQSLGKSTLWLSESKTNVELEC